MTRKELFDTVDQLVERKSLSFTSDRAKTIFVSDLKKTIDQFVKDSGLPSVKAPDQKKTQKVKHAGRMSHAISQPKAKKNKFSKDMHPKEGITIMTGDDADRGDKNSPFNKK